MIPSALICLDDPSLAFAVIDRLRSAGWRVARGMTEALELQPDLVVLDARADYLLEALKADPRTARLTAVVIGGHGDYDLKARCLGHGALAYLSRPLDLSAFDALTAFIEHGRASHLETDEREPPRARAS